MKLAFLGVGAIGTPMARRLVQAGHDVTVRDLLPERVAQLVTLGARASDNALDAVAGADAVVVMVATPQQLDDAMFGDHGVAPGLAPGTVVLIMSTVGPDAVRDVATRLAPTGVRTLDAPVTGGVVRAETGELTLLIGGPAALLNEMRPVLEVLGNNIAACGPTAGDGQAVKLVNQLLCSVHLAAAGEALAFAEKLGLDPAAVLQIIGRGAAESFMLTDRGHRMLTPDPPVTSTVNIFVKDANLVTAAAAANGAHVPILHAAAAQFSAAARTGLGQADDSNVIHAFRD